MTVDNLNSPTGKDPLRIDQRVSERRREVHEQTFYRQAEGDRARVEAIRKLCRGLKGERLLDIGCGDGSLTEVVAREVGAKEVVGIDIAAQVEVIEARGFKAIKLDLEGQDIPFPNEYFDIVVCGNVLHHLYDPDHVLNELCRVLKDSGHLVISNRNLGAWYNRLALLLGYQPFLLSPSLDYAGVGKFMTTEKGPGGHTGGFTTQAFKRLLQLHGFTVVRFTGAVNTPPAEYASPWLRASNHVLSTLVARCTSLAPFNIAVSNKTKMPEITAHIPV